MSKTDSLYRTLAEFRAKNTAEGFHFFDKGTMKFWKSRIESTLIAGRYFITSEDQFAFDGRTPARVFAVRRANDDGSTRTEASLLATKAEAKAVIANLLKGKGETA